jgi:hypothetical protein
MTLVETYRSHLEDARMVKAPADRKHEKRARQPNSFKSERRFPASRAFVVQLPEGDLGDRPSRGRVEHVRSGRNMHFDGLDGLAKFFAAVLGAEEAESSD